MDRVFFINSLTVLVILVDIFWKLTDPRPTKTKIKDWLNPKSWAIGLFGLLFFFLNYISGVYFPLPASPIDDLLVVSGVLIFVAGIFLSVWAKLTMGRNWGMPGGHDQNRQSKLVTSGPFHYTRNPIYAGLIMISMGYGLALQSYFTFLALIPILFFLRSAAEEEKNLERIFKQEYLEYKKKVPRFF